MRGVIDVAGKERDAICALMHDGLDWLSEFDYDAEGKEQYERAHALWRKHCDPEAIDCPECGGYGWVFVQSEDYGTVDEACPECYGTGMVDAPTSPPPPPPPSLQSERYEIRSAGKYQGKYRAWVWSLKGYDNDTWEQGASEKIFSGDTELEAINQAQAWINERLMPPSSVSPTGEVE